MGLACVLILLTFPAPNNILQKSFSTKCHTDHYGQEIPISINTACNLLITAVFKSYYNLYNIHAIVFHQIVYLMDSD